MEDPNLARGPLTGPLSSPVFSVSRGSSRFSFSGWAASPVVCSRLRSRLRNGPVARALIVSAPDTNGLTHREARAGLRPRSLRKA